MSSIIKIAILANAANAIKGMKETGKAADGMGEKVKGSAGKLVGLGLGAVGVGGVIDAFKAGADEAQKFQDATAQTNAALKSNANLAGLSAAQVQAQSAQIEGLTGAKIDENDATAAQNTLIRAGVRTQAGLNSALQAAADVASGTGKDIGSVSTALGKALANPTKAAGTFAKVGVVLSKSQQDAIDAMVKTGDVAGAQALIVSDLESHYNGAAKAAGTGLSADLGRAKDALADSERDIVTTMLPTLSKLAQAFAKDLPAALEKVKPIMSALVTLVSSKAFLVLAGAIGAIVVGMKAYALITNIVSIATKAWAAIQVVLDVALNANPIGLIVIGVAALIAVIVYLAVKTKFFQIVWAAVWGAIKAVAGVVVKAVMAYFHLVGTIISKVISIFEGMVSTVIGLPKKIIDGLVHGFETAWHFVTDKIKALTNLIPSAIRKVFGISSPSKLTATLGGQIVQGLAGGIAAGVPDLVRTLGTVNGAVAAGLSQPNPTIGGLALAGSGRSGSASAAPVTIAVSVPVGADPAETGRQVVAAIRAFERRTATKVLVS